MIKPQLFVVEMCQDSKRNHARQVARIFLLVSKSCYLKGGEKSHLDTDLEFIHTSHTTVSNVFKKH